MLADPCASRLRCSLPEAYFRWRAGGSAIANFAVRLCARVSASGFRTATTELSAGLRIPLSKRSCRDQAPLRVAAAWRVGRPIRHGLLWLAGLVAIGCLSSRALAAFAPEDRS